MENKIQISNCLSQDEKDQYNKLDKIKNADPLFGEKRLKEISDSLSEEDKKRYAKIGEEMYNSINFEDINSQGITDNKDEIELENVAQIKMMLSSGIHPCYLSNQEKDMMKNNFGEKWYESFGFLEVDLNRINF
jgi:hypothetical protein